MKNSSVPQATSPLSTWIYYLKHLHTKSIDLGLERIQYVATRLNLLHPAPFIITVGGTNGKGTTCRLLEIMLLSAGKQVGVYSSPHLLNYVERVRIQGEELPEAAHCKAMAIIENSRNDTPLSYFEFSTLVALWLFQQAILDIIILEVGLGGRLDATNIVDADISVITSIALDHTEWLGFDRASIAHEKAGIFRRNKVAVIGEPNRPITLDVTATEVGAILYARNSDWWFYTDNEQWYWWDKKYTLKMLPLPIIPLDNAATVLAITRHLTFVLPEISIRYGLRNAMLLGRFQCIKQSPLIIVDVAHNPHAANYLSHRLSEISCTGKIRAVIGMLANKDIAGTLSCLQKQVTIWYCASLNEPHAASSAMLASYLDNAQQFKDVLSAWHQAIEDASPEDCVLVFGSFHTVAPIIAFAEKEKLCDK